MDSMNDSSKNEMPGDDSVPMPVETAASVGHKSEIHDQGAADAMHTAASLSRDLDQMQAEVAALKDQLLRSLADAENMRRRARREVEEAGKYAITGFAREVLATADNLRRALELAAKAGAAPDVEAFKSLVSGIELTERELLAAFDRHGIKRVEPLGQRFDHNLHQALFEVETADVAPGTVVQVMASGYVIQDRLLRPAMVGVAKAPKGPGEANPPETRIDTLA
jgi:molecular chaperone GrpE